MLHEVGIARTECFITNVCKYNPPRNDIAQFFSTKTNAKMLGWAEINGMYPNREIVEGLEELKKEIALVKPQVIIALGNTALWALCGEWGVTSWRGSYLEEGLSGTRIPVIPTIHPAGILRQWSMRAPALNDLRRAKETLQGGVPEPGYEFLLAPSFEDAAHLLLRLGGRLHKGSVSISVDLETRDGHIACIGLGLSETKAICIPLMKVEEDFHYWTLKEEECIVISLKKILTHPNAQLIFQNGIYDLQYIARYWGILPRIHFDTMIAQAVAFPGTPKGLSYLSSLYCRYHRYWKDESKNWDPKVGERQLWEYNCKDCCTTFESAFVLKEILWDFKLVEPFKIEMSLIEPTLAMMLRGVKWDAEGAKEAEGELELAEEGMVRRLEHMVGPVELAKSKTAKDWWRSPKQQQTLFYDVFGLKPVINRKTGKPTVNDAALTVIGKREPLMFPVVDLLAHLRSTGVFLSTFIRAAIDLDGRIRCSYNPVGTETFRFNSSEDAFGFGTNLQNIPPGDEALGLPNVRKLFLPDEGCLIADIDLDRADLQVVVWEADDEELKAILREGGDFWEVVAHELHCSRDMAKRFTHGTNYGGSAKTMGASCGLTVHHSDSMQKRWFSAHPGIKAWHERTLLSLQTTRSVSNKFAFRRYYFDRIEHLLPEALAWVPQSTVAIVTNLGLRNLYSSLASVQPLLQVHDSLVVQYPKELDKALRVKIRNELLVEIPYDDPLTIPVGLKLSDKSWGDCKEEDWYVQV